MASFTAGTTFTDGVANDVTAAKLGALVTNATPTSGLIQDRTAETITATNDTLLIGDASDSNNLKRITVANFAQTLPTAKITTGTIETGTFGTTTSTAATITTGTITTGVIPTLTAGTTTSTAATITTGTIPTLVATTLITSGTGTAAAPAIVPTGDTNTGVFFPAADTIGFSGGGNELMRIDSSGRVGIGTTTPGVKLHISSGSADAQMRIESTGGASYDQSIHFKDTASDWYIGNKYSGATNSFGVGRTQAKDDLVIDSSGNVGIGTTSPTDAKLSVYANNLTIPAIAARYSAAGYKMGFGVYNVLGYPYLGLNCNQVTSSNNQTYDLSAHATKLDMSIDGSTPGFVFSTAASGTAGSAITWSERLRIDSSGNVGIGTTSPQAKLDVQGGRTFLSANNEQYGLGVRYINTGGPVYFGALSNSATPDAVISNAGGSALATFTNAGNVGIGTTGPVNKLEIVGSFGRGAPVTKTGDFTLADTENWIIVNKGSTCTVTLPAASSWTGREFTIKVITAHTVVSASSNVVPRNSATAGTAILTNAAGAWATLVSNGTNWVIMCGS